MPRPDRPSFTAEWVALCRSDERRRPPEARIVDDPYAGPFLEAARSRLVLFGGERGPVARTAAAVFAAPPFRLTQTVLLRHRLFDDLLLEETRAGAAQLVILGAGYDARAYRFPPGRGGPPRAFEVDRPALSEKKRAIVAAAHDGKVPEHVRFVAVDFLRERLADRLLAEGFDPAARSVFIWEGVIMYLTRAAATETLRGVRSIAAPGSVIAFDYLRPVDGPAPIRAVRGAFRQGVLRAIGEPFLLLFERGGAGEQPADLLLAAGFDPLFVHDADALQKILARLAPGRGRVSNDVGVAAGRVA